MAISVGRLEPSGSGDGSGRRGTDPLNDRGRSVGGMRGRREGRRGKGGVWERARGREERGRMSTRLGGDIGDEGNGGESDWGWTDGRG